MSQEPRLRPMSVAELDQALEPHKLATWQGPPRKSAYVAYRNGPIRTYAADIGKGAVVTVMPSEQLPSLNNHVRWLPRRVGYDGVGWFAIREIWQGPAEPTTDQALVALVLGEALQQVPPHMMLDEYDLGHRITIVEGERVGTVDHIQALYKGSVTLEDGTSHRTDAIAVVRTGTAADYHLAPLRDRLPAGSSAWVLVEARWERALIGQYDEHQASVEVWLLDRQMAWTTMRSRRHVQPRTDDSDRPAAPKLAPTARDVPKHKGKAFTRKPTVSEMYRAKMLSQPSWQTQYDKALHEYINKPIVGDPGSEVALEIPPLHADDTPRDLRITMPKFTPPPPITPKTVLEAFRRLGGPTGS